ncbi:MAG TPA: DedA family protein [Chloroflexia bacterium]|nr:DedA family protein [Chloroflexia bacterium]
MNVIEQLVAWSQDLIHTLGYAGIAFLIALETLVPPIPSEVVLPLAGSLSAQGRFNVALAIVAATIGSLIGSCILYSLSRWAGQERMEKWVDRYGKWIMLSRADLNKSLGWFERYGSWAVFICRLIPGIRSLVSIPAGLALMPFGRFLVLTLAGSAIWNSALIGAGFMLGQNWSQIEAVVSPLSKVVYVGIGLAVMTFFVMRLTRRRKLVRVENNAQYED